MKSVEEIQSMLDTSVNTMLAYHGGKVELISIDREPKNMCLHIHIAYVKMSGGCRGCAGAKYTMSMMVSNKIKEFDCTIDHVVDITDHTTDNASAFFKKDK